MYEMTNFKENQNAFDDVMVWRAGKPKDCAVSIRKKVGRQRLLVGTSDYLRKRYMLLYRQNQKHPSACSVSFSFQAYMIGF